MEFFILGAEGGAGWGRGGVYPIFRTFFWEIKLRRWSRKLNTLNFSLFFFGGGGQIFDNFWTYRGHQCFICSAGRQKKVVLKNSDKTNLLRKKAPKPHIFEKFQFSRIFTRFTPKDYIRKVIFIIFFFKNLFWTPFQHVFHPKVHSYFYKGRII